VLDPARPFLRIDPGCMEPTGADGVEAMKLFGYEKHVRHVVAFEWAIGSVLIIDNWRVLHGRGNAAEADIDRRLLRVYVR
jgi:hypothetical protein